MEYQPPVNGNPADPDRPYINANPVGGIEGSIPPAEAIEHPMREIIAVIEAAGLTPDEGDLTQLLQAIQELAPDPAPAKVITGIVPSNNGADAVNDIDFTAGSCISDDLTTAITITAKTKALDAAWQLGNGGGRSSATLADGTWHAFVISDSDGANADILFHNALNPVLPSGYTKKRRVFSFRRRSNAIVSFQANETAGGGLSIANKAAFQTFSKVISSSNTNVETMAFAPADVDVFLNYSYALYQATAGGSFQASHENGAPIAVANTVSNGNSFSGTTSMFISNARAKMYYNGGSGMTVSITEQAYQDGRV